MSEDFSPQAWDRALALCKHDSGIRALATFIQQVSDAAKACVSALGEPRTYHEAHLGKFILPEPVDPLLIEARKLCAESLFGWDEGDRDDRPSAKLALAALKRGMELAGEQSC